MDNVTSLHPDKSDLMNFYEVVGADSVVIWGGENESQAVMYLRKSPVGSRMLVSGWVTDEEEAHMIVRPLDVTHLVTATIASFL